MARECQHQYSLEINNRLKHKWDALLAQLQLAINVS